MIIGIDMGGTHIDGVIIDSGKIIKETLNNYLRCQGGVKKRLKMLIYYV
ncbi:hypothetical protein [Pseudomonas sp. C27(2019)]|nr:hypothetical protein [Pseudomonas sp. C27(2019)]